MLKLRRKQPFRRAIEEAGRVRLYKDRVQRAQRHKITKGKAQRRMTGKERFCKTPLMHHTKETT